MMLGCSVLFHWGSTALASSTSCIPAASARAGVACAVSGPIWGNLVDSGASRKWLLQAPLKVSQR